MFVKNNFFLYLYYNSDFLSKELEIDVHIYLFAKCFLVD